MVAYKISSGINLESCNQKLGITDNASTLICQN